MFLPFLRRILPNELKTLLKRKIKWLNRYATPEPEIVPNIDLVRIGPITLYWYCQDSWYRGMPSISKKISLVEHARRVEKDGFTYLPHGAFQPIEKHDDLSIPEHALTQCFCEFATFLGSIDSHFTYIDVGAFYGHTCLYVADYLRRSGSPAKAYAFEPGRAGELLPFNIALNGLQDRVKFERSAVANHNLPVLLQFDPDSLDTGTIANSKACGREFRLVNCTTLASFLDREKIEGDLLLKIDIEGLDLSVLESVVAARPAINILGSIEFNLPAIRAQGLDPKESLERLLKRNHVVILPPSKKYGGMRWASQSVQELIDVVETTWYVDLLFAPRSLVGVEKVMNQWVEKAYCWGHE